HQKYLLENLGVDISVPKNDTVEVAEIVPITKIIEGEPYQIPQKAYQLGLVHQAKGRPLLHAI
nr:hypothetical protein [Acidiferrobacterales bacterium]